MKTGMFIFKVLLFFGLLDLVSGGGLPISGIIGFSVVGTLMVVMMVVLVYRVCKHKEQQKQQRAANTAVVMYQLPNGAFEANDSHNISGISTMSGQMSTHPSLFEDRPPRYEPSAPYADDLNNGSFQSSDFNTKYYNY